MEQKMIVKPGTKGNINLMISINEIEDILRGLIGCEKSHTVMAITKIGKDTYELLGKQTEYKSKKYVELGEMDLLGLLEAPVGLYSLEKQNEGITKDSKFRVELKFDRQYWGIDNE